MRKTVFRWFIALAILLPCVVLTAVADERTVTATGTCGTNLTWTLYEDGALVIDGTGEMSGWTTASAVPWYSYRSSIKSVDIDSRVTGIGKRAFYECSNLIAVTIPDSVTSIGDYAFYRCVDLTEVIIPDGVTRIGSYAFSYCRGLTSVTISDSVTEIANNMFENCTGLTSVTIPNGVTKIKSNAFDNCTGLTSVTIGNGVKSIGSSAFYSCDSLTSVTIPDSVTSISVNAFSSCDSLTSVTIGNGVTSIGSNAFSWCSNLTSVTIGNGVTSIGDEAFYRCRSLTSVTIPDSVKSIGDEVFSWCTSLTQIKVEKGNAAYCDVDGVLFSKDKTRLMCCPGGRSGSYTIPAGVTVIENSAFCRTGLTSVTIPDGVTSIGESTFSGSLSLTSVTIPTGVTSIGSEVFNGCTSLTDVTIPKGVTVIGFRAFNGCTSLTALTVPDSVTTIGDGAFESCTGLTEIIISNGVTTIGDWAFAYCEALTGVTIPDSVTGIGAHAFDRCIGLTGVTIGNRVTGIGEYAFSWCSNLTSVTIGNGVTSIGANAFEYCTSLTGIIIPDSVTTIGAWAFSYCYELASVTVGKGVKNIEEYAFSRCGSRTKTSIIFTGNAPSTTNRNDAFYASDTVTVYYHKGTTGWPTTATWQGRPLVMIASQVCDPDAARMGTNEFVAAYEATLGGEQLVTGKIIIQKNGTAISKIDGQWLANNAGVTVTDGYTTIPLNPQLAVVGSKLYMTFGVKRYADDGNVINGGVYFTTSTDGVTWTKAVKVSDAPMAYGLTALTTGNLLLSVADTSTKVLTLTTAGAVTRTVMLDASVADVAFAEADANVYAVTSNGAIYVSTDKGATWTATAVAAGAMGSPDMVMLHRMCIYVTWSDEAGHDICGKVWTIDLDDTTGCYGWDNSEVELVVKDYDSANAYAGQPASFKSGSIVKTVYVDGGKLQSVTKSVVIQMASSVSLKSSMVITFKVPSAPIDAQNGSYAKIIRVPADGSAPVESIVKVNEDVLVNGVYQFPYSGISARKMGDVVYFAIYNDKGEQITMMLKQSIKDYAMSQLASTSDTNLRTLLVDMLNYGAAAQVEFEYAVDKQVNADLTEEQKSWASEELVLDENLTNKGYVNSVKASAKSLVLVNVIEINIKYMASQVPTASYAKISYTNHGGNPYTGTVELVDGVTGTANTPVKIVSITTLAPADIYTPVTIELYDGNDQLIDGSTLVYTMATYAYNVVSGDKELTDSLSVLSMRMVQFGLSAHHYLH